MMTGAVINSTCKCDWSSLPIYWSHLRRVAAELANDRFDQSQWTPRLVEMAIMNL